MNNDEIIEKWEQLLDYNSEHVEKTPDDKREYVALKLEEWESICITWEKKDIVDTYFIRAFIPQVRKQLGDIEIEVDVVFADESKWGRVTDGVVIKNGEFYKYRGELGIPYKGLRVSHTDGYYIKNEDGEWELI